MSGLFVCFSLGLPAQSTATLRFTDSAIQAYRQITRLEMVSAKATLAELTRKDQTNRVADFLSYELDFLTAIVSEQEVVINRFEQMAQRRIDRVKQVSKDAPWRGHCLGEMYMMRGILAYKKRDYLQAAADIRKGHQAIQAGLKQFPRFLPARRDLAILNILVGTIPDQYQWAIEWLSGIDGEISTGLYNLQEVSQILDSQHHFLATETSFLEAILTFHVLGNRLDGFEQSATLFQHDKTHPFLLFLYASIAQESGQNDETIRLIQNRVVDQRQIPFPYLDYLLGKAFLYSLDLTQAESTITSFLDGWSGSSLRADALQKLAWCALLQGNTAGYTNLMNRCGKLTDVVLEQDKQAQLDANQNVIPQPDLLRARLLFDGGYLDQARRIMVRLDPSALPSEEDKLEYDYRFGRIAQSAGDAELAIRSFERCWANGHFSDQHVVCASALQLGQLYLEKGDQDAAREWFVRCLEADPNRYRDGLHQKAKAGLLKVDR